MLNINDPPDAHRPLAPLGGAFSDSNTHVANMSTLLFPRAGPECMGAGSTTKSFRFGARSRAVHSADRNGAHGPTIFSISQVE